jgi:hypothetical protein
VLGIHLVGKRPERVVSRLLEDCARGAGNRIRPLLVGRDRKVGVEDVGVPRADVLVLDRREHVLVELCTRGTAKILEDGDSDRRVHTAKQWPRVRVEFVRSRTGRVAETAGNSH